MQEINKLKGDKKTSTSTHLITRYGLRSRVSARFKENPIMSATLSTGDSHGAGRGSGAGSVVMRGSYHWEQSSLTQSWGPMQRLELPVS